MIWICQYNAVYTVVVVVFFAFSLAIADFLLVFWSHLFFQSPPFSLCPCPFPSPLSAVPLPRGWLPTSWPGIPAAYQRGARPRACARIREEPVWDRECSRIRVPFPHLSSQGQHPYLSPVIPSMSFCTWHRNQVPNSVPSMTAMRASSQSLFLLRLSL